MKKILTCVLFLISGVILLQNPAFGQGKTLLKGKVISNSDKLGLPGASIAELDKNNRIIKGTITDVDGNYVLPVTSLDNRIQVSFVGFKQQILDINGRTHINIALNEDVTSLQGVEIVGERKINTGFMNVNDRDLAVPIEKISMKKLEDVQASTVDEALQGRISGVDIVSNSGDPGGGMSIRIRGVSTLTANSKPLIVVDNIPYETTVASDFNFATANEQGYAQMLNISVDDIKEITVLKDASATALWGTKGANGVLSITTKRGVRSRKPLVTYTYRGTFQFEPKPIPLLNGDQYSTLISEGTMNVNGIPLNTNLNKELQYDPSDPWWYYNYGQNTNWLDAISRNGFINNHDLSLTGGGSKTTYRFSVNYQGQTGVTLGTDLQRITSRLNLDYNISNKLRLRADMSYAHGKTNSNFDRYIRAKAIQKMPNMAIYEYDASGNPTPNYFSPSSNIQGYYYYNDEKHMGTYNPVAMAEYGMYQTMNDRVDTKFSLYYNILPGLTFASDVAFTVNDFKRNYFLPQKATGRPWTDITVNMARDNDEDNYTIYTNNRLTYHKIFNKVHDLTATVNFQTNDYRGLVYNVQTGNSASSSLTDPSNPARINEPGTDMYSTTTQNRDDGLLGLVNYIFKDRYIFAAGVRREGNSRFDKKYRFGYFPSLSGAWRISGEPFMQRFTFLDDFRLKFSYGQNGHSPRYPYLFFNNYSTFNWTYLGNKAIYPADMELQNLKWESFTTKDFGLTLEMFKSRLMIDLDFYQNSTHDMFGNNVPIASSSGYSNVTMNVGSMDVQGWDFSFRSYPVRTGDLTVSFDFNIARNYNILRSVADNFPLERGRTTTNGDYKRIIQVGNPIGSFYGYKYLGVFSNENDIIARDADGNKIFDPNGNPVKMVYNYPSINYQFQPGDAKYADINHDGNINYLDVVYLGDANPDFTGGFGSSVTYKAFSFNFFFYGRYGNEIINRTKMNTENMFNYNNQTTATLKRWKNPGDVTDMPRALIGYGYNWLGSDRFVEDGSFLRLKYITFTYRIPSRYLDKFGIKQARISTTLNNLLTFTNYLGQDPEISINSSDGTIYTVGYDDSTTPRTKEVTLNLSVTF
ncbi:MAG TPA: SusC/RagA family TonB-linked outer membrane protein [Bacteroidales bacterium]|nr:SusC/RagA family TonB-linked outer membrane protein [Bacteroidales bacterium]